MKQKFISALFAAALLFGMTGVAKAQVYGEPWRAEWDSCILDFGYGYYRPNRPVGP